MLELRGRIKLFGMTKKYTFEYIKEQIKSVKGYKLLSEEYIYARSKLKILHSCGEPFWMSWSHFNRGQRCPKCSGKLKHLHEFVESAYLKANIKMLNVYVNSIFKNDLKCLKCDHKWESAFNNFYNNGQRCPKCYRENNKGKNHPNWNHDLTKEDRENSYQRNHIPDNLLWVKAVYDRDNYTCQCCNVKGYNLNAHHIDSWSKHKSDRFNIDNGVTLCQTCHNDYHKIWGKDTANHDTFYHWMIRKSVIKPSNWSWIIRYPESMAERLKHFKL